MATAVQGLNTRKRRAGHGRRKRLSATSETPSEVPAAAASRQPAVGPEAVLSRRPEQQAAERERTALEGRAIVEPANPPPRSAVTCGERQEREPRGAQHRCRRPRACTPQCRTSGARGSPGAPVPRRSPPGPATAAPSRAPPRAGTRREGEREPDRPPPRAKQGSGAAQRAAHRDVRCVDRTAVLAEQRHTRDQGAAKGEYESDFAHQLVLRRKTVALYLRTG